MVGMVGVQVHSMELYVDVIDLNLSILTLLRDDRERDGRVLVGTAVSGCDQRVLPIHPPHAMQ